MSSSEATVVLKDCVSIIESYRDKSIKVLRQPVTSDELPATSNLLQAIAPSGADQFLQHRDLGLY